MTSAAQTPKYVFYFIGDGMGVNQVHATSIYNNSIGQPQVNFEAFPVFTSLTNQSANSLVTDSAAAGTALATGVKTNNGQLGTDPEGNTVSSVASKAIAKGYAAGVVTSVGINHATPGAFYAHVKNRGEHDNILNNLLESNLSFAAGGSFISDKPEEWVTKARDAGFEVYCGKGSYKPTDKPIIFIGDNINHDSLPYAIDRKEGETELADYTAAAIDHLYSNSKKGFFLMVEGGKIDYGCHATDIVTAVNEINDMAKSVNLALEFAAKHPNETLIIVTADHETSGFVIGNGNYALFQQQKCSKNALTDKLYALKDKEEVVSWPSVKNLLSKELGFWKEVEVSESFEKELTTLYKVTFLDGKKDENKDLYSSNAKLASEAVNYLAKQVCNAKCTTGSHTGAQIPVYVYGPASKYFISCRDNTDLPKTIAKVAKY